MQRARAGRNGGRPALIQPAARPVGCCVRERCEAGDTSHNAALLGVAALVAGMICAHPAQAGEWQASAEVGAELRIFPYVPQFSDQDDTYVSPSLWLEPEFVYAWNDGADRLTLIPFGRWDLNDDARSHADVREAGWLHVGDSWDLFVGINRVFWGVVESYHLIDIVNQVDLVEDIDAEQKLGQPMMNANVQTAFGAFSLFVLPGFRGRTFPERTARLRGVLPVDTDKAKYDASSGQGHVDFAGRWSHVIGDVDIGVSAFRGTSREPRFLLRLDDRGRASLVPAYDLIDQESVDLQHTTGPWLVKLEALTRGIPGDRFYAFVTGVEHTFFDVFGTGADVGAIGEYLFDSRSKKIDQAPPTFADNDVFTGMRISLNDAQSTQVLAGALVDTDTKATVLSLEAERRIESNWKAEIVARFFLHVPNDEFLLTGVRDDDMISLRLIRYF